MSRWRHRVNLALRLAALVGVAVVYFVVLMMDRGSTTAVDLPDWYLWPARFVPAEIQGAGTQGYCYAVSYVNGEQAGLTCRQNVTAMRNRDCFASAKNIWCINRDALSATLAWFFAFLVPMGALEATTRPPVRRFPSAAERHGDWQKVVTGGLTGLFLVVLAYGALNVSDIFLDRYLETNAPHLRDLTKQEVKALPAFLFGMWFVTQAAWLGVKRRRDFYLQREEVEMPKA